MTRVKGLPPFSPLPLRPIPHDTFRTINPKPKSAHITFPLKTLQFLPFHPVAKGKHQKFLSKETVPNQSWHLSQVMKDECISGSEQRAHWEDSWDRKLEWPSRTGCCRQGQAGIFGCHTQALAMGDNSWTEKSGHDVHTQKIILYRMIQKGNRLEAGRSFIYSFNKHLPSTYYAPCTRLHLEETVATKKKWILASWTLSPAERKRIEQQVSNDMCDMKEKCQVW